MLLLRARQLLAFLIATKQMASCSIRYKSFKKARELFGLSISKERILD